MLTVAGLTVCYDATTAVADADLTVPDGTIVAVLGPSGSGKTSLLRAVAGLETPAAGRVEWDGDDLTRTPPHRRGFGLMFQDHALFEHLDVGGNVAFGLRMQGRSPIGRQHRVDEMLELVGLAGFTPRAISELSGGEQQRVALARALAPAPRLLMLDEPLASVDRERREQLAAELHRVIRATGTAALLVTHDLDEAFTLGDDVVVLDRGRVVRSGPAREVWSEPGSLAVARFLGVTTDVAATVGPGHVATPWGDVATPPDLAAGTAVRVGWRAADLAVRADGAVAGTVRACWFRRDHFLVELDTAVGPVTARASEPVPVGACAAVAADLGAAVVLDA